MVVISSLFLARSVMGEDATLLETQRELKQRTQEYWTRSIRHRGVQIFPESVTVLGNNFALIGLITGISAGLVQQGANTLNIVCKAEKIPLFEGVTPVHQSKPQTFGRILISGAKGSCIGASYGCSYFISQAFEVSSTTSLFFSGFTAGAFGGFLWRSHMIPCIGYGLFAGFLSLITGELAHYGNPPTIKSIRTIHIHSHSTNEQK